MQRLGESVSSRDAKAFVVSAVDHSPHLIERMTAEMINSQLRSNDPGERRAVVGDTVVASAPETQRIDGYHYFDPASVNWDLLEPSSRTSVCHWKGVATYYDVVVGEERYPAAAWTYADPSEAAASIKGHVAFWRGVTVVGD